MFKIIAATPATPRRMYLDSGFRNNYFTEMCSGSEEGSYLRLIDFVYHSNLGLRVIKKRRRIIAATPATPQRMYLVLGFWV